ncbi:MAG: hypothetical protein A2289_00950 [Deltaproteobacteria bacterium RIFOXYA12_FULL_58_15]|nr:MAG: hypothetical protein A2289_00950 [Deltaproteobacteria bacterium RIFOXYA12_FULL_58_15]OGR14753.1 MAG: hypothetical protein A2341_05260 [Deltaproteobacteria bacterium RIFOXYB12_FULL_58_9]
MTEPTQEKQKILVVDDEQNNLDVVTRVFRREFHVLTATSGEQGLEILKQNMDVILVISDQRMPGLSGSQFLSEVFKIAPETMRVMMTGYADHDAVVEAVNLGKVWSYIRKPVAADQLRETVQNSVEVYHLAAKNRELTRQLEVQNRELVEQKHLLEMSLDERTMKLIETNKKLAELAVRDGLTGLYNHRYFQDRAAQEISRAKRYNGRVGLVFIDIDHFKDYNDTHGHPKGDDVLREIAELITARTRLQDLKARVRDTDLVARYGGEEFVILMPETDTSGAVIVGERLRAAVGSHPFKDCETQPGGALTVSVGVASYPEDASSREELITRADQALYEAKRQGRNRVCAP